MDPRDFYALAERMAAQADAGAAEYRTVINRAYYAAYNVGVEYLRRYDVQIPYDVKSHADLRNLMKASDHPLLKRAGQNLLDLYRLRERADYRMEAADVEGPSSANRALTMAKAVIDCLQGFHQLEEDARRPAINKMKNATLGRVDRF